MLTLIYLYFYGRPFEGARLTAAIEQMHAAGNGTAKVLEYTPRFHHPAFVPWLLAQAEQPNLPDKTTDSIESDLEAITWQRGIVGIKDWKEWYAAHGRETQTQWIESALNDFDRLVESNPAQAAAVLKWRIYQWGGDAVLERLPKWCAHAELHEAVATWLQANDFAAQHARYAAIAKRILDERRDTLRDWARQVLQRIVDKPPEAPTWEDQFRWRLL